MQRHCELTGTSGFPQVQGHIGEMAAFASIVELMVKAQETEATVDEDGVVWPSRAALYAIMALQAEINPRLIDIARELSGEYRAARSATCNAHCRCARDNPAVGVAVIRA